jgi:hypothetical protein
MMRGLKKSAKYQGFTFAGENTVGNQFRDPWSFKYGIALDTGLWGEPFH